MSAERNPLIALRALDARKAKTDKLKYLSQLTRLVADGSRPEDVGYPPPLPELVASRYMP